MNRYNLISLIALSIFVLAMPVYALHEPDRMAQAETNLRQQFMAEATGMYLEICASCHGAGGEGLGIMPPLNNPALAKADYDVLFKTIARASHGTSMAAWHVDEGGILSDYQIEQLITLIRHGDWSRVAQQASSSGFVPPTPPRPDLEAVSAAGTAGQQSDPHECRACHEQPALHTDRFGLDCARCHGLEAWTPARLTRHTFLLDHGGTGVLTCQTCHTETYGGYTCYQCHDHQPDEMRQVHTEADIEEFDMCIDCHPTGLSGEAENFTVTSKD